MGLEGSTIYCTLDCITAAKLIVMSGIVRWAVRAPYDSPIPERDLYWKEVLS
jgi:deoxycytidylate deaminase